jgi:hypothetical protein
MSNGVAVCQRSSCTPAVLVFPNLPPCVLHACEWLRTKASRLSWRGDDERRKARTTRRQTDRQTDTDGRSTVGPFASAAEATQGTIGRAGTLGGKGASDEGGEEGPLFPPSGAALPSVPVCVCACAPLWDSRLLAGSSRAARLCDRRQSVPREDRTSARWSLALCASPSCLSLPSAVACRCRWTIRACRRRRVPLPLLPLRNEQGQQQTFERYTYSSSSNPSIHSCFFFGVAVVIRGRRSGLHDHHGLGRRCCCFSPPCCSVAALSA